MNDLTVRNNSSTKLLPDFTPLDLQDFSAQIVKEPLFCPRKSCPNHHNPRGKWFDHFGRYPTAAHGWVNRFICKRCGKTCSAQTFHFTYYAKTRYPYPALIIALSSTCCLRALSRLFGNRSPGSISNHIARLARQAMAMKAHLMHGFHLPENLCADGFLNFCVSQYFPTQSHIIVGSNSLMLYYKDIITQRRSGRMSEAQKARRAALEQLFTIDPRGVEKASFRFISAALDLFDTSYQREKTLITDMHHTYAQVFDRVVDPRLHITHFAISSKAARTKSSPLFPVNYFDREIRKDLHDCVRETVCFPRNLNRHMQRFSVYQLWHNYLKPFSVGTYDRRPHGVVAGMNKWEVQKQLNRCLFIRAWSSREPIELFDRRVWREKLITPLAPLKKTRPLAKFVLR